MTQPEELADRREHRGVGQRVKDRRALELEVMAAAGVEVLLHLDSAVRQVLSGAAWPGQPEGVLIHLPYKEAGVMTQSGPASLRAS